MFDKMFVVVHSLKVPVPHSAWLFLAVPGILCVAPTAVGVSWRGLMTLQQHKAGSAGSFTDCGALAFTATASVAASPQRV